MRWLKDLGLIVCALAVGLLGAEAALAALGYGALYQSGISRIHDEKLLYRLPANFAPEIDERGFRNESREKRYDVVALGDSHTYGYNVQAAEAWPQQLAARHGLSIYNMGMGGWGPAQYLLAADEALALKPKRLVIGFYLGNDLSDACGIADRLAYWRDWYAAHGLTSPNCGSAPLAPPPLRTSVDRLKAWIKSTRLGSLLDQRLWLPLQSWRELSLLEDGDVLEARVGEATVLVDPLFYETAGPDAADGARIAAALLAALRDKAAAADARIAVVFIPSKLAVLHDSLVRTSPEAEARRAAEARHQAALERELDRLGVQHASALPRLQALVARGESVYPSGVDDHPLAAGQRAYAEAAAEALAAD